MARLGEYHAKRDAAWTPEPRGSRKRRGEQPVFVVQRHDASSPHFDFRLEIGGVLVSWSVPEGPSLDPGDRRPAIRTEDHPFDVLTEASAEQALADGHLKVGLHGEKLTGGFSLVRRHSDGQEQRLLIKKDDEGADRRREPAKTQPQSVLTGRTNRELE
jgi:hypothetical protein